MNIFEAAKEGNNTQLELIIKEEPSINIDLPDNLGWTALQHAVLNDQLKTVQRLITLGANPNASVNEPGFNAFHLAALKNNIEIFNILVEAGADFTITNKSQETVLHIAMENPDMIKHILNINPEIIGQKNNLGLTVLDCAVIDQHNEVAELLVEKGAEVTIKTINMAVQYYNIDILKYLVNKNIDINIYDKNGWNAIHYVCFGINEEESVSIKIINSLLGLGVKYQKDNQGYYPIDLLGENKEYEIVELKKLIDSESIL